MKNKIYHLSTCNTCQRIIKGIDRKEEFELIDIKVTNIGPEDLDWLKDIKGSYEALFSRRARKYSGLGLNKMILSEDDYRKYILQEYTFLKRPVIIYKGKAFIGNAKKEVERAYELING